MTKVLLEKKRNLKPGEMIKLSYDEAFKIMYGDPKNIEILTFFLSKVLGVKYEDLENKVTLLPLKTPNKTLGEKIRERDVVSKIEDGKISKIILEVNISKDHKYSISIIERNLLYLDEVASSGIRSEDSYDNLPETILFNFNNFYINSREKVIDEYMYRNIEGDILSTRNRIININIDKCYKLWYNKDYEGLSEIEKEIVINCAALSIGNMEEFNDCLKDLEIKPEIGKLMEKVVFRMSQDEELVRRFYKSEEDDAKLQQAIINERSREALKEGMEKGLAEGIEKGLAEGIEKGRISEKEKMVLIMLKNKESMEKIQEYTGLKLSEINEIIKNN